LGPIEPTKSRDSAKEAGLWMVNLQAGELRGTVAISAPNQRTAEPQRKNEMEWGKHFLRLGAGRYRRTQRPIIGGKPLEPGGSRKELRPRP
jgi:hypothetical protein